MVYLFRIFVSHKKEKCPICSKTDKMGHMKNPFTEDEFLAKFKETYPEDYEKCWKKFKKEEMNRKMKSRIMII